MKKICTAFLAILILVFMSTVAARSLLKVLYPQKYEDFISRYSAEYGVDTDLIYAVIRTESSFNPTASSEVGAAGLMQIMPDTLEWLCYRSGEDVSFAQLQDPETSIRMGTYLLKLLSDEFGDTRCVLAAYHAGRGRVVGWLQDSEISKDGKTLYSIPYRDTAHYVSKVERAMAIYKNLYS